MKQLEYVLNNEKEVLAFLKSQYPLYHLSNVFFRDVQYGIQKMFERQGKKVGYPDAEKIAREFVGKLEKEKILTPIDRQSWVLNYPEYKTVAVKPAAPAKAAPGAAPVKSPAVAGVSQAARPPLPPLGSAKPVGAKPALPPLSSAKPVGEAKPVMMGAASVAATPSQPESSVTQAEAVTQSNVEQQTVEAFKPVSKPMVQGSSASPVAPPPGQRKPLPPLKGNYTPAGKN
ncbi:MAG: hypothetical protein AAB209_04720 [Bacteroidota bacterium]